MNKEKTSSFREKILEGKILPSHCLSLSMADDAYDLKEHVNDKSITGWVFFFPLEGDRLRAVCVSREELERYTKIFFKCTEQSMASIVYDDPFYQLQVNEYPIYIRKANFDSLMSKNHDLVFFIVYETNEIMPFSASQHTIEYEDFVSGDYCQKQSSKRVSEVYPLNEESVETTFRDTKCYHKTKQGLDCLMPLESGIEIDHECFHYCKQHFWDIFIKIITVMWKKGTWRRPSNPSEIVLPKNMTFIAFSDTNKQLKFSIILTIEKKDNVYEMKYGQAPMFPKATEILTRTESFDEIVTRLLMIIRDTGRWKLEITFPLQPEPNVSLYLTEEVPTTLAVRSSRFESWVSFPFTPSYPSKKETS